MANFCPRCGAKLPMLSRLTGKSLCSSCQANEKLAQQAASLEYGQLLSQLTSAPERAAEIKTLLTSTAERAGIGGDERVRLHINAFETYLERALDDDHLTTEEETQMTVLANTLDISQPMIDARFAAWIPRLLVARCNNGRLPAVPAPRIILKKGEVAHMEADASLLKEVVHREYRGGYSGVSFRVAKGVRFHTGGTRGKSVVTGTSIETADTGFLTVTSQRVVYTGARQTIEMPYTKLVSMNVFNDGIQFHLSNRKNPPLFRLKEGLGNAVAAVVNAAAQ